MVVALSLDEWISASREKHATLGDVRALPPGDHCFVCLDRNVWDTTAGRPSGPASRFFDEGYWLVLRRKAGDSGLGRVAVLCDVACSREVRAGKLLAAKKFDRELDLEFEPGSFYPLEDGTVPTFTEARGGAPARRHWSTFEDTALVGWRGPMVPAAALDALPPLRGHHPGRGCMRQF